MATIVPITNLRGPAARIVEATSEVVPADQPADVIMTGPDQGRRFHFKQPRGLPGVNGVENDEAVAVYVSASDTDTGAAVRAVIKAVSSAGGVLRVEDVVTNVGADVTDQVQDVIDAMTDGRTLVFGAQTWKVDGTLTIPHDDFTVRFETGAVIDRNAGNPAASCFVASGDRFRMQGAGEIVSPAVWDGTNSTWTYAVVLCTGDSPKVADITLTRVPRIGIGFKDTTGIADVREVQIYGQYPSGQWTEVETMHAGIAFDPGANAVLRTFRNTVESCVQGFFTGNFGTGSTMGSIVTGNDFRGCHNHAVYVSAGASGMIVAGNSIIDCSRPIAMTGPDHVVEGNTQLATDTGGNLHAVCNIHMRNASGCVVTGNKMRGDVFSGGAPAIQVSGISGGTFFKNNIITDNIVEASDTYAAVGISIGGTGHTVDGAIVRGNVVTARGIPNQGVITLFAGAGLGSGVKILDNVVRIRGESHGIYLVGGDAADVRGNDIRLEWDAAAAKTLGGVVLSTCAGTRVAHNNITVSSAWGANVSFRAVYELAGVSASQYIRNRFSLSLTKLVAAVTYFINGASGSSMDEQQPGAPTFAVTPGSQWLRTDGAAATSLYVKETAASSAVWRAV